MFQQSSFENNLFYDNNESCEKNFQKQLIEQISKLICQHSAFSDNQTILNLSTSLNNFLEKYLLVENISSNIVQIESMFYENKKIASISKKLQRPTKFICAEINNLPFLPMSFDRIISFFDLNFVNNINDTLVEIHKLLKPDGIFLFATHDRLENSSIIELISSTLIDLVQDFNIRYSQSFFKFSNDNQTISQLEAIGFKGIRIINKVITRRQPTKSNAWLKESCLMFGHYIANLDEHDADKFLKAVQPKLEKLRLNNDYIFEDSIKLITAIR